MKKLYLIIAVSLISFTTNAQIYQSKNIDGINSFQFNSLDMFELIKLSEITNNNYLFSQNEKSFSKVNDNKRGVYEVITKSKNYRTGAVENSSKVRFNYNSSGFLYQETYYTWNVNKWDLGWKIEYTYSSNKLTLRNDFWYENNAWQKNTKTTFTYNSKNDLKQSITQYQHSYKWTNKSKYEYYYKDNNNLDYILSFNWTAVISSWTSMSKSVYTYYESSKKNTESDSKLSFITNYSPNNGKWENSSRTAFVYNESDNMIEESYESWTSGNNAKTNNWSASSKTTFAYNSNNKLEEYINFYTDGTSLVSTSKNNYTYDEFDNVNSSIQYNWDVDKWKNKYRTTNLVYDNSYAYNQLVYPYVYDDKIEQKHLLISYDKEEWTNNSSWVKTGGSSIDYVDVQTLNTSEDPLNTVKVYPNPTSSFLFIEFDKTMSNPTLEIFGIDGNKVLDLKVNNRDKINIRPLNSGVYFYILSSEHKTSKGKILVK